MIAYRVLVLILLVLHANAKLQLVDSDSDEQSDEDVQSEWLSLPGDDDELAVTETAPQCGNENTLFPESGVEDIDEGGGELMCEREEVDEAKPKPKPKPQCKCCCEIGAKFGKAVKKGKCPFIQCRNFFLTFYKQHKKCIKHPKRCGFFFVKCCVRQHHKDIYAPQDNYDENQVDN